MRYISLIFISIALFASCLGYARTNSLEENKASIDLETDLEHMQVYINQSGSGCTGSTKWDVTVGGCSVALLKSQSQTSRSCSCSCPSGYSGSCTSSQTGTINNYGWNIPPDGDYVPSYSNTVWDACTISSSSCMAPATETSEPETYAPPPPSGTRITFDIYICDSSSAYYPEGTLPSYYGDTGRMNIINEYVNFNYGKRCPERGGYVWWQERWTEAARASLFGESVEGYDVTWPSIKEDMLEASVRNGENTPAIVEQMDQQCEAKAQELFGASVTASYVMYSGNQCEVN